MPDYLYNLLKVSGEADRVDEFIEQAMGEEHEYQGQGDPSENPDKIQDLCFHSLYPVPSHILALPFDPIGHAWETEHWGVTWGTSDSELKIISPTEIQYTFSTPWGFPSPFLDKIAADFPHLRFERRSIDPGNSTAYGSTWVLGKLTEDWERESSDDEYEQLEMAWKGHLPLSHVLGNLKEQ